MTHSQLPLFKKTELKAADVQIFIDGAARGNPGPAGVGVVFMYNKKIERKAGFFVGNKTNNQAEYLALIMALMLAHEHTDAAQTLQINSDSELLVCQVTGRYRVKNSLLAQLYDMAMALARNRTVQFVHIARELNQQADRMANYGIDSHQPVPTIYKQVLNEHNITL